MMERKAGECCLEPKYGQSWQMGRIMLKFRPIAPKPAALAPPVPVPLPVMAAGPAKGKRKMVPWGSGRRGRIKPKKTAALAAVTAVPAALKMGDQKEREKDKSVSPTSSSSGMTSLDSSPPPPPPATLSFMPVLSVEKEQVAAAADLALSHAAEQIVAPRPLRPAAVTWVTVEAVTTGTWSGGEASSAAAACGSVDDGSPSFVSDQWGGVTWTNTAFDRAASAGGAAYGDDNASASDLARVVLTTKDDAAVPAWGTCAGFSCRVRVRHACPRRGPLVVPCDVWRLDTGGYLWRLDLQATLSLSLSLGGLL